MTRKLPPLPWLRAFEASARHLSFTNAANELNLTQAAISKQVKLLEHYLREPLFQRKPRSLVLTKVGAAYLPKVRDSFERLAAGTEEVFGNRRTGALTVRCTVAYAACCIAPRLPDFYARHPKVSLRIVSSVWGDDFDGERFDLDVQYGTGRWSGYVTDRLTHETLTPLCSPGVRALLRTPDDLASQPLLHVMGYEEGWSNWLAAAGAGHLNAGQGLQFDSSLLAFETAAAGLGVALARSSLSKVHLASGRLVQPFELTVPVEEAFYLLTPAEGTNHPDAALFRDWLIAGT